MGLSLGIQSLAHSPFPWPQSYFLPGDGRNKAQASGTQKLFGRQAAATPTQGQGGPGTQAIAPGGPDGRAFCVLCSLRTRMKGRG